MTFSWCLNLHAFVTLLPPDLDILRAVIRNRHCLASHKILVRGPRVAHTGIKFTIRYKLTKFPFVPLFPDDKTEFRRDRKLKGPAPLDGLSPKCERPKEVTFCSRGPHQTWAPGHITCGGYSKLGA